MPDEVRQKIKRIRTARWVMVAITAALALVLAAKGDILIGGFLAVMASMRAWMLYTMPKRMRSVGQQRREGFNPPAS
ncbi:MAG TPA: hypothetical protein VGO03_04395 [Acidimicrobiia bacterium]